MLLGLGGVVYNWHSVLTEGVHWSKAVFIFTFFACVGRSLIL